MRDIHNHIDVVTAIAPVAMSADVTGLTIDTQGYNSCEMVVHIGITAETWSSSVRLDLILQHGALADASDMAAVAAADFVGTCGPLPTYASGIFASLQDAAVDDVKVYKVGYRGTKRYVRIFIDEVGTQSTGQPVSAVCLLGHAHVEP